MLRSAMFLWMVAAVSVSVSTASGDGMVWVEPGSFELGLGAEENLPVEVFPEYIPRHAVRLSHPFMIGARPITFRELLSVFDWGVRNGKLWKTGDSYILPWFGRAVFDLQSQVFIDGRYLSISAMTQNELDSYPAVMVSWFAAVVYCNLRSQREGFTPAYSTGNWDLDPSATGYRLPTEAEWVWVYKGGVKTENYVFSGSNIASEIGWFDGNSTGLMPVGKKKPNELGVFDMAGNVFEWCNDWYGPFELDQSIDPRGPGKPALNTSNGEYGKVSLGGSWNFNQDSMRYQLRGAYDPASTYPSVGFRVVRGVK